ncbi:MAG: hypothetical protein LLG40_06780 [Deltaproteobacteria bacterium]|nr:hypothetical protein [Deltaproteobacteria bacterium]
MSSQFMESIAKRLAFGQSVSGLSKELKIPVGAILAVKEAHPELIEREKQELRDIATSIAINAGRRLHDNIDEIPIEKLANTFNIAINTMQLLNGDPTSISKAVQPELPQTTRDLIEKAVSKASELCITVEGTDKTTNG